MRKISILLLAGIGLAGSILHAQEPASYYKFTDIPVPLNAISNNKEWVGGSFAGVVFIQNTTTHQTLDLTEEGNEFDIISGVSDNGTFVGTHGKTIGSAGPAYLKNGEWNYLETLNGYMAGGGLCITADSKMIAGYISGEMGTDNPNIPVIWKLQNDGSYKIEALPYPEKDIFGMSAQGAGVLDVSTDGSVLIGRFTDYTSFYEQPIKWTLGSDGKYTYELMGTDLIFNIEETNPGPSVLFDNYVTAEPGTSEYEEQYKKFKEEQNKRNELMDKFLTDKTFAKTFKLNGDGNRVLGKLKKEMQEDPEDPFSSYEFNSPYCFNLKNGTATEYSYNANICAVTNSGKIFFATPNEGMLTEAYIIDENEREGTPLNEWLKNTYNLNIDQEQTIEVDGENKIITGNITLNKSEDAFISSFWDDKARSFANYMVKLPAPVSPASISYASDNTLQFYSNGKTVKIDGDVTKAEITDLSGKVVYRIDNPNYMDLNFLPSGIYVMKVLTGNGSLITKKVSLN